MDRLRFRGFSWGPWRGGIYQCAKVSWVSGRRNREVEIDVSPTGRSVRVYVDGVQWKKGGQKENVGPRPN